MSISTQVNDSSKPVQADRAIHEFKHGSFDIQVMTDGFIFLPPSIILPDAAKEEQPEILARLGGNSEGAPFHTNIPLIRAGNDLILVDNGSGNHFQATAGNLAKNLAAAGIDPLAITKVVLTHAHPDHSGGTVDADGAQIYPNAQYYVSEDEWQFWMDPDFEIHMPEAIHDFARGSQRDLSSVKERLTLVKAGDEIVSGMAVVDTRGHTPGHVSLELLGSDNLIVAGDVSTSNIVFFEHPEWHFGFDTDPELALTNRKRFLDRIASERTKVLGYHWSYPGTGYAERSGLGYRFVSATA